MSTYSPQPHPTLHLGCLATKLPSYQATKLPSYQATKLPSYQATKLPSYQATKLPSYQATKLPSYQATKPNVPQAHPLSLPPPSGTAMRTNVGGHLNKTHQAFPDPPIDPRTHPVHLIDLQLRNECAPPSPCPIFDVVKNAPPLTFCGVH